MDHRNKEAVKKRLGIKSVLAIAALAGVSSAQAGIVQFNPAGAGSAGAIPVTSAITAHGSGFVMTQPNPNDPTNFLFSETGAYQLTQPDGSSPIGTHDITLTYSVMGTVNPLSGALSFSTGAFSLYSDATFNYGTGSSNPSVVYGANDGSLIASFLISSGLGNASGNVHLQGTAIAGSILPGFFFSSSGIDLSTTGNLQFAVDIGNAIDLAPSATVISELVCKAAGFPGPGCNGSDYSNTPYYFVVSDGGATSLSTNDVPEPGSGSLVFAGIAGLGLFSRRSRKQ